MVLICKYEVFKSKVLLWKTIFQECCIVIAIFTITLFSFTENSNFSSSFIFEIVELFAIISIIGAAAAEFILLASTMTLQLTSCCRKRKRNKVKGDRKLVDQIEQQESGLSESMEVLNHEPERPNKHKGKRIPKPKSRRHKNRKERIKSPRKLEEEITEKKNHKKKRRYKDKKKDRKWPLKKEVDPGSECRLNRDRRKNPHDQRSERIMKKEVKKKQKRKNRRALVDRSRPFRSKVKQVMGSRQAPGDSLNIQLRSKGYFNID